MLRFALTRALSLALSLAVASLVIFAVVEVVPGDPASYMLGLNATPEAIDALRDQLGLNGSLVARYIGWVGGMLTGDFGTSYTYKVPVAELVAQRLWVSLPLALFALTLSTLIAFPVGLIAAARRGSATDYGIMGATQLGIAVPNFWFAMLLVLVFAVNLQLLPAGGFPGGHGRLPGASHPWLGGRHLPDGGHPRGQRRRRGLRVGAAGIGKPGADARRDLRSIDGRPRSRLVVPAG